MNRIIRQRKIDTLWIGICFISVAVFSIIGLKMYDPILSETNYIKTAHFHKGQIVLGAICELILVVSMLGSAIFMFPYLNRNKSNMGVAYISFRAFECVFVSIDLIAALAILSIIVAYSNGVLWLFEMLAFASHS